MCSLVSRLPLNYPYAWSMEKWGEPGIFSHEHDVEQTNSILHIF